MYIHFKYCKYIFYVFYMVFPFVCYSTLHYYISEENIARFTPLHYLTAAFTSFLSFVDKEKSLSTIYDAMVNFTFNYPIVYTAVKISFSRTM